MLLARHENRCLERPNIVLSVHSRRSRICTNKPARKKKKNLRVCGPNNLLARFASSGVSGFRTLVFWVLYFQLSFWLYFCLFRPFCICPCICILVRAPLYMCICILLCARASLYLFLYLWVKFGAGSRPPHKPGRRHPDHSVQDLHAQVSSNTRLTQQRPSPREEMRWTFLALRELAQSNPAHNIFLELYIKECAGLSICT